MEKKFKSLNLNFCVYFLEEKKFNKSIKKGSFDKSKSKKKVFNNLYIFGTQIKCKKIKSLYLCVYLYTNFF